jgi:hypothetical protein
MERTIVPLGLLAASDILPPIPSVLGYRVVEEITAHKTARIILRRLVVALSVVRKTPHVDIPLGVWTNEGRVHKRKAFAIISDVLDHPSESGVVARVDGNTPWALVQEPGEVALVQEPGEVALVLAEQDLD